jgi:hypothetical protein
VTDAKAFPTPVEPPAPTPEPEIGRNFTTRATSEIQELVGVTPDGDYGGATTKAVKAWQEDHDLVADGDWGALSDGVGFARTPEFGWLDRAVETVCGTKVAGRKITGVVFHHTATKADQRGYFAGKNDRLSCPWAYLMSDGVATGFVRASLQPWSTGVHDRDRLAVEIQNTTWAPDWGISDAAQAAAIDLLVALAQASEIDGVPVEFVLDREHVVIDSDFRATECPGPYVKSRVDGWITQARERVASEGPGEIPVGRVDVDRDELAGIADAAKGIGDALSAMLKGA